MAAGYFARAPFQLHVQALFLHHGMSKTYEKHCADVENIVLFRWILFDILQFVQILMCFEFILKFGKFGKPIDQNETHRFVQKEQVRLMET